MKEAEGISLKGEQLMSAGLPPQVRLANEIAIQFAHLPFAEGVQRVATHMHSFWEPRMLRALLAYIDAGGPDLDPLAAASSSVFWAGLPCWRGRTPPKRRRS